MNCFKSEHKKHRAETKRFQNCCPEKAAPAEHSWRGVLRGHVPSKSPSADGEIPCAHASGRRSKVGEKSDSFSRAERTRPLRPVSRLQYCDLGNVPVERFQRNVPDANLRTRHAVSLQRIAGCFLCRWESVCNVPPGHCKNQAFPLRFHTGSGLVRSPQKAIAFCPFLRAPEAWRREFRCLRTAT